MMKRQQELTQLKAYTDNIEKEVTLLLQSLQWDPKLITEKRPMVVCKHDSNHRIPLDNRVTHETQCYLTKLGYREEDTFLPEPIDLDANTLVKFSKHEINDIINNAANANPLFKRGVGSTGSEPMTVERLQRVYTADERLAVYDAVVNTAPFCHDLAELDLPSTNNDANARHKKSRLEILAELRNMKRRRTKYRVPTKTRNYSDVLREVIKTQMDSYGEATRTIIKTEYGPNIYVSQKVADKNLERVSSVDVTIKVEKESPERCSHREENPRGRYRARSREKRYIDDRRGLDKEHFSSNDKSNAPRHHHRTERSRENRQNDDKEKRYHNKKYSSRDRSKSFDDSLQRGKYSTEKSRKNRYDGNGHAYHKDKSNIKTNESYRREIQPEPQIVHRQGERSRESFRDYSRENYSDSRTRGKSRSEERRDHDKKVHKKKHSKYKRKDKHDDVQKYNHKTYSPDNDYYNTGETSTKRYRERSKSNERRHKHKKVKHNDKHSSRREKERDSRTAREYSPRLEIKQERNQDYSPGRVIKQERNQDYSPRRVIKQERTQDYSPGISVKQERESS